MRSVKTLTALRASRGRVAQMNTRKADMFTFRILRTTTIPTGRRGDPSGQAAVQGRDASHLGCGTLVLALCFRWQESTRGRELS